MKLRCYAIDEFPPRLVAARAERDWMSAFQDRHAYRCLPLSIANATGWEALMPIPLDVEWNGGMSAADLRVSSPKALSGGRPLEHLARSNFSRGIVTFHVGFLFQTDPGWDLLATGSFNRPKDGVAPLSGIIESDWLPYPFTMNWQMLRPGRVRFEEDEPFCLVMPVPKQSLVDCQPEILRLADHPDLQRQYEGFKNSREDFMKLLNAGDPRALRQGWQRHYFVGRHPDGTLAEGHLHKLRLPEPVDLRPALKPPVPMEPEDSREPSVSGASAPARVVDGAAAPSAANEAGRARIDAKGQLRRSARTAIVTCAAEASGRDFVLIDDFYSERECELLCRAFEGLRDRLYTSDKTDPYWNDRFVFLSEIVKRFPDTGRLMIERQRDAVRIVSRFYSLQRPLYPDLLQIAQWQQGMFMRPHADNANPDGSHHPMAHRQFASVAYLNDDYEGGELYFTALDVALKPRRGAFVAFTGGFHHEHAVLRVGAGSIRMTVPSFYTFDAAHGDPLLTGA